jgi:hypothetical protein
VPPQELLFKTWSWTLWSWTSCHEFRDANIWLCLSVLSQDGWKPSPHRLKRPRRWPGAATGNYPVSTGPAFVAKMIQLMAKGLKITWKFHMAYSPWSSGKVEWWIKL